MKNQFAEFMVHKKWIIAMSSSIIKRKGLWGGLILLFILYSGVQAQTNSNARSLGMARAYTAVARGVAAPVWNPANLALPDRPSVSIHLVGAGFRVGNLTFSKSTYDKYNGEYLSSSDVADILASVPDEGFQLVGDTDVQAIGVSIGSFALTMSGIASSNLSISKDYLRILLEGVYRNSEYDIGNNAGEVIGYSNLTASYALPLSLPYLGQVYFGSNVSYILGIAYGEVLDSYGHLRYGDWEVEGDGRIQARYAQGGAGFAADFGIAKESYGWQWGISLKNVISKVNWSSETEKFEAAFFTKYGVNVENAADKDSVEEVLETEDGTTKIDGFSTSLPTVLRIGATRQWRSFLLSVDYHQGFSDRLEACATPYLAASTEWQGIGFLPLRLGFGFGGDHGTLVATGFGLKMGFFHLDYGISFHGGLWPTKASTLGMALSTYLSF